MTVAECHNHTNVTCACGNVVWTCQCRTGKPTVVTDELCGVCKQQGTLPEPLIRARYVGGQHTAGDHGWSPYAQGREHSASDALTNGAASLP